jgi:tetratricopeptide (TPR) repeat protein
VATAIATNPNPALAIAFASTKNEATLAAIKRALGLGDRAAAERELARARAEAADDSRLRLGAALIKRAAGDLTGALTELNEAARLDPNRAEIYAQRAAVRAKLGHKAEDIREDYLRGGGLERDFAAFYEAQTEKLGGGTPESASGKGSGGGKSGWDYAMDPAARRRQWVTRGLMGFGLLLVAAALLRLLKRGKDDSETGS